ncbi:MAG: helix-turn-helix domain-containing protein [Algoriphagus sp.]|nr:helix-turn-helix domain-containing protein [Algoriphagus sp.]
MLDLIDFSNGGILCGLLSIYVLLFKKDALRSYSDYLLATFIFFQCWAASVYVLIFTGAILEVPHFFKSAAPLNFLIPPLAYLYVRSVLFNEGKGRKCDLLHFLPFAIFLGSYLPFFFSAPEVKLQLIEQTLSNKNESIDHQVGLFSESFFHFCRLTQAILYLVAQSWLIFKFDHHFKDQTMKIQIHRVVHWLKIFTGANTVILLSFLVLAALYFQGYDVFENDLVNLFPHTLLGVSFFLTCAYLLIYPQVVIGMPFRRQGSTSTDESMPDPGKFAFSVEDYSNEINQLKTYFESTKAYLQPSLSISEVAVGTGIPARELSYLINAYHKKRFNDFLNEMRLLHFLQQVAGTTLDTFTVEAIALEAGFSSKSAFYRSFKRFYGCTPLEYLRNNASR